MPKMFRITAVAAVFLVTMLALAFTAGASIGGFSISPTNLPENQVDGIIDFFDLWVTPGQTQEVTFEVRNGRDETITVELSLNSASTIRTGVMVYSIPDALLDDSLEFRLDEIVSFPGGRTEISVEIPGRTAATIPLNVAVPAEGFDGMVLGAVRALMGPIEEDLAQPATIRGRFANTMPIRLRINDIPVEPGFALGAAGVDVISHRAAYVVHIHNTAPRRSRDALASMWIYPAGSDQPVFFNENMRVDFAPNAVFAFTLRDEARYGIFPGNYVARVRVEYDDRVWEFEERFTVTMQAAREMAEYAAGQARMLDAIGGSSGPSPALTIALISITVLLLLAIVYLMRKIKRNRTR